VVVVLGGELGVVVLEFGVVDDALDGALCL
jgi:hypothetical protein